MIIKYTAENIIIWHHGEKYLASNDIIKYYTSIYDNCYIEFDDDTGDVVFDSVIIELNKDQYKDLNKVINRQISNKRETLIDNVYDRLIGNSENHNNMNYQNQNNMNNQDQNNINHQNQNNYNNDNRNNDRYSNKNHIENNTSMKNKHLGRSRGKYIDKSNKNVDFFYVYKRHY